MTELQRSQLRRLPRLGWRLIRFAWRAKTSKYYPVAFNEPVNVANKQGSGIGSSLFGWSIPALSSLAMPALAGAKADVVVSERIVEMPFVHRTLASFGVQPPARILEFGCAHSKLALELCALGYRVVGLDLQAYGLEHPNLEFVQRNILTALLPSHSFDAITAISVVEHAGLEAEARYGVAEEGENDQLIVNRLRELLAPRGLLILTVPYGKAGRGDSYRVYDQDSLDKLTWGWHRVSEMYALRRGRSAWIACTPLDLKDVQSTSAVEGHPFPVNGVAMLGLLKPAE